MIRQADIVHKLTLTSSRKEKERLVKDIDKRILEYTYHPHKRYFLKPDTKQPTTVGTRNLNDDTWRVLDLLSTGKYRGDKAKALYNAYVNSLNPKSKMLFDKILSKDLKCGVNVKTVNKVYPGLVPDEFCMLCTDVDANKLVYPCYASVKVDGDRAIFIPDKGLFSRQGKKVTGLDHIELQLQEQGVSVDGELRDPSLSFSCSSGLLRSNKSKATMRYFIFDSHIYSDKPFWERYWLTKTTFMTGFPCMHVIEHFKCDDELRLRVLYERAVRQGHEGIVVKKYDHMYQFKRSSDWMRMVPVKTADVVVVDITPGTKGSKYDGVVGALVVEYNNLVQKVGSGLSDAERTVYMDYPSDIIGKVIEVEYKGETDYGKMRQPRFKRVRYDKNI